MIFLDPQSHKIYFAAKNQSAAKNMVANAHSDWKATNLYVAFLIAEKFFSDSKIIRFKVGPTSVDVDFAAKQTISLKTLQKTHLFSAIKTTTVDWAQASTRQIEIFFQQEERPLVYKQIDLTGLPINNQTIQSASFTNLSSYTNAEGHSVQRLRITIPNKAALNSSDHRELNKQLELFKFTNQSGGGLPFWLPRGELVKNEIKKKIRQLEEESDYTFVTTPVLAPKKLFARSGHLTHYQKYMFPPLKMENEELMLRPMTCPQHCLIFNSAKRSYHDLPMRLSENSLLFRFESSGSLLGLQRTRQMELKDTHIFVQKEPAKIKAEIQKTFALTQKMLDLLGIKVSRIDLSIWDEKETDKYYNDKTLWAETQKILDESLSEMKVSYRTIKGEAAFYGPKIDFQIFDSLGHLITVSTIQLDFLLPQKFALKYRTNKQDSQQDWAEPIIIHHGIIGTYERILSVLLEKNSGWLPFWMAPQQISLILFSNNEKTRTYAQKTCDFIRSFGYRVEIANPDLNARTNIKNAWLNKIPLHLFIGDEEIKTKELTFTFHQQSKEKQKGTIFQFLDFCRKQTSGIF